MRRKITLLAVLAAALMVAAPAIAATQHSTATKATTITVKATEFKFALSKTSAPKGTVNFKVTNKGKVDHDFKINGKKTKLLAPGKSADADGQVPENRKVPVPVHRPRPRGLGHEGHVHRQVKLRRLVVLGAAALTTAVVASVAALVATAGSSPVVAAPRIPPARPAVAVPQGALVLARQDGTRVLALSVRRDGARVRARVTVLGPEGAGVGGLAVSVGGVRAVACGRGCYAASLPRAAAVASLSVRVRGPGDRTSSASFALPRAWPVSAVAALRQTERTLRSASSVVYRDRLESVPGHAITTTWRVVAPDRLAYTVNNGTCAVVVGQSRWDRESAGGPWLRSSQERLDLPALPWGAHMRNVYLLDPPPALRGTAIRFSMFDPATPAWYDVLVDARSHRIRSVQMIAPSHFMHDDYLGYGTASPISPPTANGSGGTAAAPRCR